MLLTFLPRLKPHIWGGQSVFDSISCEDLIMAFFPCVYFSCLSQMSISWEYHNYVNMTTKEATDMILERSKNREYFFGLAAKMLCVAKERGLRLIMENPWSMQHFLKSNFVVAPTFIDKDRSLRGDIYKKPTAYWFINCNRTNGLTIQKDKSVKRIVDQAHGAHAGLCSEERSMIEPDYARNFICDFILGKEQIGTQLSMFE